MILFIINVKNRFWDLEKLIKMSAHTENSIYNIVFGRHNARPTSPKWLWTKQNPKRRKHTQQFFRCWTTVFKEIGLPLSRSINSFSMVEKKCSFVLKCNKRYWWKSQSESEKDIKDSFLGVYAKIERIKFNERTGKSIKHNHCVINCISHHNRMCEPNERCNE